VAPPNDAGQRAAFRDVLRIARIMHPSVSEFVAEVPRNIVAIMSDHLKILIA